MDDTFGQECGAITTNNQQAFRNNDEYRTTTYMISPVVYSRRGFRNCSVSDPM